MNQSYLAKFTNNNIEERLLKKENLITIKDTLEKKGNKLIDLRKKDLDFENIPKAEALFFMLYEVKVKVDKFLGVKDISSPGCRFSRYSKEEGSYYLDFEERIRVIKDKLTIIIPQMAHEYTHHVQNKLWGDSRLESSLKIFEEGYARGVQRYVSGLYAKSEDNEAFLYDSLEYDVAELKSVYKKLCRKLEEKIEPLFYSIQSSKDDQEQRYRKEFKRTSPLAIGNTFFMLLERKHGTSIYKDILQEKFNLE